ncbi:MAG: choice-of-anchor D domain-containing protein [Pseudomonadota bacterium]
MKKIKKLIAITSLVCFCLLSTGTKAQFADENVWCTDGIVNAVVQDANYVYIGGSFDYVGPNASNFAKITTSSVQPDVSYPAVNGEVSGVVPDGVGGYYMFGDFTQVGPYARNGLAHIKNDKSLDLAWNPPALSNSVASTNVIINRVLADPSGIYVCGKFTHVGSVPRINIVRLLTSTGQPDASWNANANDAFPTLTAGCNDMVINGNDFYVTGNFTAIGSGTPLARQYLAKLNKTTGACIGAFNYTLGFVMYKMIYDGGFIYGTSASVYKLDATTGASAPGYIVPAISGASINQINSDGAGNLYAGGTFTSLGGQTVSGGAKINMTTGSVNPSWNPAFTSPNGILITKIIIQGGFAYFGGSFSNASNNTNANRLVRFNTTTGALDATWLPNPNHVVNDFAVNGSDIALGGKFSSVGGIQRRGVARINKATGQADAGWNANATIVGTNFNVDVKSIALDGSSVYISGAFTIPAGPGYLAKLNNTTGAFDPAFSAPLVVSSFGNYIYKLLVIGNSLYAGGQFGMQTGNTSIRGLVKIDKNTGATQAFSHTATSANLSAALVRSLAYDGTWLYVGGNHLDYGAASRRWLYRINPNTGAVDPAWNTNLVTTLPPGGDGITDIEVIGSDIYVCGYFTSIGGQTRHQIAKLNNTNGNADATFNANYALGSNKYILSIADGGGGNIIVGLRGTSNSIGGQNRLGMAKLNKNTGVADPNWDPNTLLFLSDLVQPSTCVNDMIVNGTDIYLGGYYNYVKNFNTNNFAKLSTVLLPAIQVKGNNTVISNNDVTPTTADFTDFGNVVQNTPLLRTFKIINTGDAPLIINSMSFSGTNSGDFSLAGSPSFPITIQPQFDYPFQLQFVPSALGLRNANLTINNNDTPNNPFIFAIKGTGITGPEINVLGNGNTILDGDAYPTNSNFTDFGNVLVSSSLNRTFVLQNLGSAALTISGISFSGVNASEFTLVSPPTFPLNIASSASQNITVQFLPTALFLRTATINIASNDADEATYDFMIQGNGSSVGSPAINVQGNGNSITDGNPFPTGSNNTDFGTTAMGTPVNKTFVIQNTGTANLSLTGITFTGVNAAEFTLVSPPTFPLIITLGNSSTITVSFLPTAAGIRNAFINIANNDVAVPVYDFALVGNATASPEPEIQVLESSINISDGGNYDFGLTLVGTPLTKTFTIKNIGTAPLTLGALSALPAGFTLVGSFPTANIAAGSSTTFQIKLDGITLGNYSGTASFVNGDGDENPFNFTITGTVTATAAPEIQVLESSDIADGSTYSFGNTPQNTAIIKEFTIKNIGTAPLSLGALSISVGNFSLVGTFPTADIAAGGTSTFSVQLDATTIGTYSGSLSFVNGDSDENPFDIVITGTVITAVGINEITFAKGIAIYPNPANDQITISTAAPLNNASVSILDLTGRLIFKKNNLEGKTQVINISALDAGIYFIEINQGNDVIRTKVIKE